MSAAAVTAVLSVGSWFTLATFVAIAIGLTIREADRREQPRPQLHLVRNDDERVSA